MITVIDSKLLKNKIFSVNKTFITIPFFNILLNIYIDLYTEEDKTKIILPNKAITKIIRLA